MSYKLTSTNLQGLGVPMGSETTSENFTRFFSTIPKAQKAAEKDYNGSRGPIEWKKEGRNRVTSGDLGYVMYDIEKVRVE